MAAQAALEQVEGPLSVGLVNYDEGTANGQERERGVLDALARCGRASVAAEITTLVDAEQAREDTAALLAGHPDINVLVAFNEPTSVGAAQAVEELGLEEQVFLVGFDSNVATIEGLQTGSVDALVVQNPYAMGYLGVERPTGSSPGRRRSWPPWWTPPPRSFIGATCFPWTVRRPSLPSNRLFIGHYVRYFPNFLINHTSWMKICPWFRVFFPCFLVSSALR